MKAKRFFTSLTLLLGFFIMMMMFAALGQGTGVAQAQEPDGDVGAAAAIDTFINIPFPIPADGVPGTINVDVGDTINIPVQMAITSTAASSDTVNFVELTFQLPPNNVIQVLDVVAVQSNFSSAITTKNIAPNNTVSFRIDFLPGVPVGTPAFTIANIRVKALKIATPARLTFSAISRVGYTEPGGISPEADFFPIPNNFLFNDAGGLNVLAPDTAILANDSIPFTIRYPQMIVYIDERLTTPPNYDIKVGQTVDTEVKMSEVAAVTRIRFQLDADPSVVNLVNVTPSSQFVLSSFDSTTNEVELTSANGLPVVVTSDSTIATLTWEGIAPGSLGQSFQLAELYDADDVLITDRAPVTQNGGTITVEDQAIRIFLDPSALTIPAVGETGVQVVKTEGVFNVGELDFILTFDESVVDVESVQVSSLYSGATAGVIGNSINFSYSGARISEDGDVLIITWRGVGAGTNKDVSFSQSDLVVKTENGSTINSVTAERGSVTVGGSTTVTPTVTATPTATTTPGTPTVTTTPGTPTTTPTPTGTPPSGGDVNGIIEAEGRRPNFAGVQVFVSTSDCAEFTPSGSPAATTASDGSFSISNSQSLRCLKATRQGHLVGQKSNPAGNLGLLELLAGDLNGDNKINILDLAQASSLYQQADAVADFNGSGTVDILDLSLIARNYGLVGPTSDWR